MRCSHEPCVSRTCESWSLFSCDHGQDRKSTRLNSSHLGISYAVFCLKKKHEDVNHAQHVEQSHLHDNVRLRPVADVDARHVSPAGAMRADHGSDRSVSAALRYDCESRGVRSRMPVRTCASAVRSRVAWRLCWWRSSRSRSARSSWCTSPPRGPWTHHRGR